MSSILCPSERVVVTVSLRTCHRYCVPQNLIRHKQVLLDLAAWLEVERSSVTHLIASRSLPVLAILVEQTHIIAAVAGMSGVSSRLYRLWEIALVVSASSLVRNEFIREAEVLRRLLMKGLQDKQDSGIALHGAL